jgi:hypothetical protein
MARRRHGVETVPEHAAEDRAKVQGRRSNRRQSDGPQQQLLWVAGGRAKRLQYSDDSQHEKDDTDQPEHEKEQSGQDPADPEYEYLCRAGWGLISVASGVSIPVIRYDASPNRVGVAPVRSASSFHRRGSV